MRKMKKRINNIPMLSKFLDSLTDFCSSFSDFSDFQKHRLTYVPRTPVTYAEGATVPISMAARDYPMADALQPLFPTLIGQGMQYFELKSDAENGTLA
jgi:hypothetical protein